MKQRARRSREPGGRQGTRQGESQQTARAGQALRLRYVRAWPSASRMVQGLSWAGMECSLLAGDEKSRGIAFSSGEKRNRNME